MRKPRRNHSAAFKPRVALEAIRGEKTLADIAAHQPQNTMLLQWTRTGSAGTRTQYDRVQAKGCQRHSNAQASANDG